MNPTCLVTCHTQSINWRNTGERWSSAWFLSPWPYRYRNKSTAYLIKTKSWEWEILISRPTQALSALMCFQKSPFCVTETPWLRLHTGRRFRIVCDRWWTQIFGDKFLSPSYSRTCARYSGLVPMLKHVIHQWLWRQRFSIIFVLSWVR